MKKLLIVLALFALIVTLVACGDTVQTTVGSITTEDVGTTTGGDTDTTTTPAVEEKIESYRNYTGIVNPSYENAVANGTTLGDVATEYEFFGAAKDVANRVNMKYTGGGSRVWQVLKEDGTLEPSSYAQVGKLGTVAAKVEKNAEGKNVVTVREITIDVFTKYSSIKATSGAYIMFEFYSSLPATFTVGITAKAGDLLTNAVYKETQIPVEKNADGSATGLAKFTVPHMVDKTYYLNLYMGSAVVASKPIETTQGGYPTNICRAWVRGPWEEMKDRDFVDKVVYEFYACFPQILARYAILGNEPREIEIYIEDNNDIGAAWAMGNSIGICLDWANNTSHELKDIDFLSHELGHSAQQFGDKLNYGDQQGRYYDGVFYGGWFTEQMASYAGFRYYHWGTVPEACDLDVFNPSRNYSFDWTSYGNCGLFFAYVDWYYCTYDKNGDRKITDDELGVIDALYKLIKNTDVKLYDTPVPVRGMGACRRYPLQQDGQGGNRQ